MTSACEGVRQDRCVVLGVGNALRTDDGLGVHIVERLRQRFDGCADAPRLLDAGTLGLSLLPDIEGADGLVIVDAAEIDAAPGVVRAFEDAAMDERLAQARSSVHEVSMADLLRAAMLMGVAPRRRALVAVQPSSTDWGAEPSGPAADAILRACAAVEAILERWST